MCWLRSPAISQGLSPDWSPVVPSKASTSHTTRNGLISLSHEKRFTCRSLDQLTTKRNRRVDSYLHTASRRIMDLLVAEGIGTLVIGKNLLWKQEVSLGKRTNQQFVQIPHARFIDHLVYKAKLVGITVLLQEESYTSQASFLDRDPIQ